MQYTYQKDKLPKPIYAGHDDWVALYYKAWELAFENVDYIQKENWKPQMTCMPGVGIVWQWDSCFMVLITKYANGTITALNNLDNMYRLQREDGFIAMAYKIDTEDEAYVGRINPPLYAWAEWEHFLVTGDDSRFDRVVPIIEKLYTYIENNRRRNTGLYWFEDSGSSGMDNSPRAGYPAANLLGSDVCFIDLGGQQALTAKCLSQMYAHMGDMEKSKFFAEENARICALINKYHWHEGTGFYYDFFSRANAGQRVKLINTKTMAAAWPVLCGAAQGEKLDRVLEHFFNPDEFYTKIPFATLSKDDLNYDEKGGYWLGGVWAPTNYALIRALTQNGNKTKATAAAIKYLDGMCRVYEDPETATIWEAYAPEDFKPSSVEWGDRVRPDFVGWSGLAPITMLIENIIGIHCNAERNEIVYDVAPTVTSGVENLLFAGGTVSIVTTDYNAQNQKATVTVTAEKPFTLRVNVPWKTEETVWEIKGGTKMYQL